MINSIIGSGIFGLPSQIAALVGRASPWAILAAALGIAAIMACFAELASRFQGAGGPYLYVRTAFGQFWGIEVGWLTWVARLTACAANANLFVIYLGQFVGWAKNPLPRLLVLTLLIGGLAVVNLRGVKAGAQLSNVFTTAKLIPLLLVAVGGSLFVLWMHPRILPAAPVSIPVQDWLQAILLMSFAFGGFEAALIPAAEASNPRRDAPFALLVALGVCTLVYTLVQVAVVGLLPNPALAARPVAAAAEVFLGSWGGGAVALGALVSVYGYLAANTITTPRLTYALAEAGDLPACFGRVSSRFRAPYVSILIYAVLVWMLAVWGNFTWNATLSTVARLFSYSFVCAAMLKLRRPTPHTGIDAHPAQFHLPVGWLFAAVGILYCLILVTRMGRAEVIIMAITTIVAVTNWRWARRTVAAS